MNAITTHVLDTTTDADARLRMLVPQGNVLEAGDYRLRFDAGAGFAREGREPFCSVVHVSFRVAGPAAQHHVPLLLAPFGFSTYRGS